MTNTFPEDIAHYDLFDGRNLNLMLFAVSPGMDKIIMTPLVSLLFSIIAYFSNYISILVILLSCSFLCLIVNIDSCVSVQ